jgi:Golgi nucleoside diphosphatase
MEELKGRPEYCLDLSFMYALLRLGYEFGEERGVRIGKKVCFSVFLYLMGLFLMRARL